MLAGPVATVLVALLALLGAVVPATAQVTVAAASDLQTVMPELTARFKQATGQSVRVSFGSSGQFATQIQNGAPFDVFLSADDAYIGSVVESGYGVRASVVQYATGRLALWTRRDTGFDISRGLPFLSDGRVRRIAIANPQHAPYGRAAVEALRKAGIYEQIRTRLVLGENVSQAAQFAQTGNADVALIALSLTRAPAMQTAGTAVEIPADAYPAIRQSGVLLARAAGNVVAQRFLAFVSSAETSAFLRASGFGAPQ